MTQMFDTARATSIEQPLRVTESPDVVLMGCQPFRREPTTTATLTMSAPGGQDDLRRARRVGCRAPLYRLRDRWSGCHRSVPTGRNTH